MSATQSPISANEQRDHLANTRTMLAWVRTSITVMALGFAVSKFGLVIDQLPGHHHTLDLGVAADLGIALVIIGGILLLIAGYEFLAVERAIQSGQVHLSRSIILSLSGLLAAVAVVMTIYLIATS